MLRWSRILFLTLLVLIIYTSISYFCFSSAYSQVKKLLRPEDTLEWLKKYKEAKPEFKPGDVIGYEDRAKIEPFLPPELWEVFIFPGMKMEIGETRDYTPHHLYVEATKKFSKNTKIGQNGELIDFVAGMPFPFDTIKEDDPYPQIRPPTIQLHRPYSKS